MIEVDSVKIPTFAKRTRCTYLALRADGLLMEDSYEDVLAAQQDVVVNLRLHRMDPLRSGPFVLRAVGFFREGGGGDLGAPPCGHPEDGREGRILGGRPSSGCPHGLRQALTLNS